jgi:murein DD-endopeptidase MepM/ murein hydrolase activator NlpD
MGFMRRSRAFVPVLIVLLLSSLQAAAFAQTDAIEEAKGEKDNAYDALVAADAELQNAVDVFVALHGELEDLEYRIGRMEGRINEDATSIGELQATARELVVNAYINSGSSSLDSALDAASIQDILTAQHLLERAADKGTETLDRLDAITRDMERKQATLEEDRARVAELEKQQAELVDQLDTLRDEREAAYQDAKAKYAQKVREWEAAERARKIAEAAKKSGAAAGLPPGTIPDFICPVQGPVHFTNDWGNPRSGGRTHKGTDMFAARNTPVVAVVDGTVRFSNGGLGGIAVWIKGSGASFYYAHLDHRAEGLQPGAFVTRGTVIGYVGNTGNAMGGATHLHFQLHPGHGSPVNPYPTLAAAC